MKIITATLLAILASTTARAELLAEHIAVLGSNDALIFQLSDTTAKSCDGAPRVLLSATTSRTFPRAMPYGDGCWYVTKGGMVVVEGRAFHNGQPIYREISVRDFTPAPAFQSWEPYVGAVLFRKPL